MCIHSYGSSRVCFIHDVVPEWSIFDSNNRFADKLLYYTCGSPCKSDVASFPDSRLFPVVELLGERMSSRNRGPLPMKGISHGGLPPPVHEPPFARGRGPMHHPALLEELRESQMGRIPVRLPPHHAIIEERLAAQHEDIQGFLVDNQRLAATHVALKQELEAAHYELQRMLKLSESLRPEKDVQMRELYEKSVRMEMDLRAVEAMKAELCQVNADIKDLTAARQELTSQVQVMSQDLTRMNSDLQQVPALRADIENMKQEIQRIR